MKTANIAATVAVQGERGCIRHCGLVRESDTSGFIAEILSLPALAIGSKEPGFRVYEIRERTALEVI